MRIEEVSGHNNCSFINPQRTYLEGYTSHLVCLKNSSHCTVYAYLSCTNSGTLIEINTNQTTPIFYHTASP